MATINRVGFTPKISLSRKDFDIREMWKDPTARTLLLSNLVVLAIAIAQNWDFTTFLWTYFIQNLIIGFFTFLKILLFGNNTNTEQLKVNGAVKMLVPGRALDVGMALFFAFHYGFFHLVYFIFLSDLASENIVPQQILIGAGIFFINHLYSFLANYHNDKGSMPKAASIMSSTYMRIIPMHIIIIIGGSLLGTGIFPLIIFVLLKTIFDIKMHNQQHNYQ